MAEPTLRERLSGVLWEDLVERCAQEVSHGGTGDAPALREEAERQAEALISTIGWAEPVEQDELRGRLAEVLDPFVADAPAGSAAAQAVLEVVEREAWGAALRLTVGYELGYRQHQRELAVAEDRIEDLENALAEATGSSPPGKVNSQGAGLGGHDRTGPGWTNRPPKDPN